MATSASWQKNSTEVLDYSPIWTQWLGASETITTSTWVVDAGITKDSDTFTTTATVIWLSGGTPGVSYNVKNRIVTNQGRTKEQTLVIRVV